MDRAPEAKIADHGDRCVLELFADSPELVSHRIDVEQRLRRMLAFAIAAIDDGHVRRLRELVNRLDFRVPYDERVDIPADHATRVFERFTFDDRGERDPGGMRDGAAEPHESGVEAQSRPGTRLEKETSEHGAFQHAGHLFAARDGL